MKTTKQKLPIIAGIMILIASCTSTQSDNLIPGNNKLIKNSKQIQVASTDTTGGNNDRINIKAGEKATILDVDGPGLITRIWVTIDSRDPDAMRRILIRGFWDGEENPSIEVPLGDFFGSGFEYKHHLAHYCGMSSGGYYCYFPMPFNKSARIEITNESDSELFAFYYHINYYQLDRKIHKPRYFHAWWNRDPKTTDTENYVALEAEGKGQFVGMNFSGQPYNSSLFYLEGDEMIYVDGEENPSIYGTGFEDYFTSGWYFKDGVFSAPYHGLVLLDEETGRVTAYRHHIPDAIPFDKSIKVTYEHGTNNEAVADFSTTVYWYQEEPHKPMKKIAEAGQRIGLRRPVDPMAVEVEDIKITGDHIIEDMSSYGVDWSNNTQVLFTGGNASDYTLTIDNLIEQKYDIKIYPSSGPSYGNYRITSSDGKLVSFEAYAPSITAEEAITLKNIPVINGNIVLNLKITGKNIESDNYNAAIDAILTTPVREYISDWWMIGPFPNPRENDYLRYGLDSIYPPEKEIDLNAIYTGSDDSELKWFRNEDAKGGYDMSLWKLFNPSEFIVIYALTYVYSPEDQTVPLMLGSDDGAKVFINNKEVYRYLNVRIAAPDQENIPLNLKKGWNKLMIKAENNFGGFAFYARIIDQKQNLIINAGKN